MPRGWTCLMFSMWLLQKLIGSGMGHMAASLNLGTQSLPSVPLRGLLTDPTGWLQVLEPVAGFLATIFRKTDSTKEQTDSWPPHEWSHKQPPEWNGAITIKVIKFSRPFERVVTDILTISTLLVRGKGIYLSLRMLLNSDSSLLLETC